MELNAALRASGRKVTPQRELVVRILEGNETHPTAEAVYVSAVAHMPSISLKTVYSVLHEIDVCRVLGMRWYYLGLWVEDCAALRYKSGYHPHERLVRGRWVATPRPGEPADTPER